MFCNIYVFNKRDYFHSYLERDFISISYSRYLKKLLSRFPSLSPPPCFCETFSKEKKNVYYSACTVDVSFFFLLLVCLFVCFSFEINFYSKSHLFDICFCTLNTILLVDKISKRW